MKIKADLILIRGLPGSGKTTYAEKNFKWCKHFEADQYHVVNGTYNFIYANIKQSHETCFNRTEKALNEGHSVVVANTFTTHKEMAQYLELVERLNKKCIVLRMCTQFESIHSVPMGKIEVMRQRFQDFPEEVLIK